LDISGGTPGVAGQLRPTAPEQSQPQHHAELSLAMPQVAFAGAMGTRGGSPRTAADGQ